MSYPAARRRVSSGTRGRSLADDGIELLRAGHRCDVITCWCGSGDIARRFAHHIARINHVLPRRAAADAERSQRLVRAVSSRAVCAGGTNLANATFGRARTPAVDANFVAVLAGIIAARAKIRDAPTAHAVSARLARTRGDGVTAAVTAYTPTIDIGLVAIFDTVAAAEAYASHVVRGLALWIRILRTSCGIAQRTAPAVSVQ